MAWNEPGNNDNDPWKNRGKDQGPPDLDELFKDLGKRFNGMFGGKPSGSGDNKNSGGSIGFVLVLSVAFLIWVLSGIYTLKEAERGVVLTFGQYSSLEEPGIQFKWTFIQEVHPVNIQEVRTLSSSGFMLTKDENVVRVEMEVQYKISNPRNYLFATPNPENSLRQATESALRMAIGHSEMDAVLTSGREEVRQSTWRELENIIEAYQLGVVIDDVNFKDSRPPEQVKDAFDDAIKAQTDEERFVNQAKAYESEVEPRARGQVNRMIQEATAYKQGKILAAQGQVAKFEQLLPEYKAAPKVTKDRLYLETMEQVYSNTSKILVNSSGGNNMMYLPLDKIIQQQKAAQPVDNRNNVNYNTGSGSTTQPIQDSSSRSSRSERSNQGRN